MLHRSTLTALTSTLILAASAAALPPEVGWTKHENPFIAHIDVARVADSVLRPMLDQPFRVDDADEVWRKLTTHLALVPGRDVRTVTILNVGPLNDDIVIVGRMSERADLLPAAMAEHIPGYRATEINGHTIHSWAELVEGKRRHIYGHIRAVNEHERLVIISTGWEYVLDTLAFADGREPAHPVFDRPSGPPRPMENSAVYVYVPDDAFQAADHEVARTHLERMDWIVMDIGATAERAMLRLITGMNNEEDATEFVQVGQGMLALARMMMRDDESMKPVMRLIEHARVGAEGSMVKVEFRAPAALFGEALDAFKLRIGAARRESGRFALEVGAQIEKPQAPAE